MNKVKDEIKNNEKLSNRRDFISKYGKLAVITPVAVTTLISPSTSAAPRSCRGYRKNEC